MQLTICGLGCTLCSSLRAFLRKVSVISFTTSYPTQFIKTPMFILRGKLCCQCLQLGCEITWQRKHNAYSMPETFRISGEYSISVNLWTESWLLILRVQFRRTQKLRSAKWVSITSRSLKIGGQAGHNLFLWRRFGHENCGTKFGDRRNVPHSCAESVLLKKGTSRLSPYSSEPGGWPTLFLVFCMH